MKLYGMAGKGTGRVGSMVYAVRKGEQIVRQYNPNVANPNTRPQVEQRAKFKLLSQLTAAIGNDGLFFDNVPGGRTMRNEFMRRNMGLVSVAPGSDEAAVDASALELTSGAFSAPETYVDATSLKCIVDLSSSQYDDIAGACAVVLVQPELGRVIGHSMRVVREAGANAIEVDTLIPIGMVNRATVLVWVYKFRDDAARARYEQAIMSSTSISVAFNRALASGDIIPSVTTVAPFTQA